MKYLLKSSFFYEDRINQDKWVEFLKGLDIDLGGSDLLALHNSKQDH